MAASKNLQIPLVICDYQMPGKTGVDFLQELRASSYAPETQVIILSSAEVLSQKRDFADLGVKHVLTKPCPRKTLIEAVSNELFAYHKNRGSAKKGPLTAPEPKAIEPEPLNETGNDAPFILVADDDEFNRSVFTMFLEKFGYRHLIVNNGLEALQAAKKYDFDAILMDISMPVMNGPDAAEQIRLYEFNREKPVTPIIAVTAHALAGDKDKYGCKHFDDYLFKPVRMSVLETALKAVLSNHDINRKAG